jgi:hypothetical protein
VLFTACVVWPIQEVANRADLMLQAVDADYKDLCARLLQNSRDPAQQHPVDLRAMPKTKDTGRGRSTPWRSGITRLAHMGQRMWPRALVRPSGIHSHRLQCTPSCYHTTTGHWLLDGSMQMTAGEATSEGGVRIEVPDGSGGTVAVELTSQLLLPSLQNAALISITDARRQAPCWRRCQLQV